MARTHVAHPPHPLSVFVPEAYRYNLRVLLARACEAGWTDRHIAQALFGDTKKFATVWRWRAGLDVCCLPREMAEWLNIDLARLLYGDVSDFVVLQCPEVPGVKRYKPRVHRPTAEELIADGRARNAERARVAAEAEAAALERPQWVRPER